MHYFRSRPVYSRLLKFLSAMKKISALKPMSFSVSKNRGSGSNNPLPGATLLLTWNTPLYNGAGIAASQNGCTSFDPALITSTADASGGSGAPIEYRWLMAGNVISGAAGNTYDPGPVVATTSYIRQARRGTTAWISSNTVTMTVNNCDVDLVLTIEQNGSSILAIGGSLVTTFYVENIQTTPAMYTLSLTKPSAASGLSLTVADDPSWTVTTAGNQYIIKSTSPLAGNSVVKIPVTITRTGGSRGSFSLGGQIISTTPAETNLSNNTASVTVTKN
jgi:hypothetical protein